MHTCPICGYPGLVQPFTAWMICPCCGNEAENDDATRTHAELRQQWVASGGQWWSPNTRPTPSWSATAQLRAAGHAADADTLHDRQQIAALKAENARLWLDADYYARCIAGHQQVQERLEDALLRARDGLSEYEQAPRVRALVHLIDLTTQAAYVSVTLPPGGGPHGAVVSLYGAGFRIDAISELLNLRLETVDTVLVEAQVIGPSGRE